MTKRKAANNQGHLTHPLPRMPKEIEPNSEAALNWEATILQLELEKLAMLRDAYGIDAAADNPWLLLALVLARKHEPGFQIAKNKGRPGKWDDYKSAMLVVEMERLIRPKSRRHGAAWAASVLCQREPWKSFLSNKEGSKVSATQGEALRARYYSAKKTSKFIQIFNLFFSFYQRQGELDKWENLINDCMNY